jgi:hypothetical protein
MRGLPSPHWRLLDWFDRVIQTADVATVDLRTR